MRNQDFKKKIEDALSAFISEFEFELIHYEVSDMENNEALFYESKNYKLCIYKSSRNGEVNCLIGDKNADISNLSGPKWKYLNSYSIDSEKESINTLLKLIPDEPIGEDEQISILVPSLRKTYIKLIN